MKTIWHAAEFALWPHEHHAPLRTRKCKFIAQKHTNTRKKHICSLQCLYNNVHWKSLTVHQQHTTMTKKLKRINTHKPTTLMPASLCITDEHEMFVVRHSSLSIASLMASVPITCTVLVAFFCLLLVFFFVWSKRRLWCGHSWTKLIETEQHIILIPNTLFPLFGMSGARRYSLSRQCGGAVWCLTEFRPFRFYRNTHCSACQGDDSHGYWKISDAKMPQHIGLAGRLRKLVSAFMYVKYGRRRSSIRNDAECILQHTLTHFAQSTKTTRANKWVRKNCIQPHNGMSKIAFVVVLITLYIIYTGAP